MSEPVRCNCPHDVSDLPFGTVVGSGELGKFSDARLMVIGDAARGGGVRVVFLNDTLSWAEYGAMTHLSGEGWYIWETEE